MRRLFTIALLTATIGCSAPEPSGSVDAGPGVDAFSADAVADGSAPDVDADGALESGELLTGLDELEAGEVVLRDAGDFLFLFADGRELAWIRKEEGTLITFATWPDAEHEGSSRGSLDYAFGDDRVWFASEMGDGTSALVGAEHDLGNPFPFFGQPIVIIDVGPRTSPAGIAIHQNRIVAEFDTLEGVSDPTIIVATEDAGVIETVSVENLNVFHRLDLGPDGVTFWTAGEPDGAQLQTFTPGGELETLTRPEASPRASDVHDEGYVWLDAAGDLWARGSADADPQKVTSEIVELADGDAPEIASNGETTAVAHDGVIRLVDGTEFARIDAEGEVHSLIFDASSIFWSTTQGVYRYDVTR